MKIAASVDTYTNNCIECGMDFQTTIPQENTCEFCFPSMLGGDKHGIGELSKLTNKIEQVADKLVSGLPLTEGETNLAKNILRREVAKLVTKSKKSSDRVKSTDPKKEAHRRKIQRYSIKRQIERLTEGVE